MADREAIDITLDSSELDKALEIVGRIGKIPRLMPKIAVELLSQAELNFEKEGRAKWQGLAERTKAVREKKGTWPGKILQDSGALSRALISDHGDDFAAVGFAGAVHDYAAAQQFGFEERGLVARPVLPMDGDGKIQPEAEQGVLDVTYVWVNAQFD